NDERKGPISTEDLLHLIVGGTLTANSLVWTQGMGGWLPVEQINELASLLSSLPPEIPRNRSASTWSRLRKHLGSSLALVFGSVEIVAGLSSIAQTVDHPNAEPHGGILIAGVVMILGALAYRSAKKRRLGEAKSTLMRRCLEIGLLMLICLVI